MARQILLRSLAEATTKSSVGAAAAFVALCALTLMACASHSRRWWRFMASHRRSSDPVISIQQVQPGVENEACIWQKGILMGGKCQLPEFSGIVMYDSAGNLMAPGRPHATSSMNW
ncbi:uncharacterized protein [Typha angustifolia]|uniref:uncharacterized protein n=1 Tax=Typha angustifolia TaxID=59011 RepID=UPI003C2ABEB8